MKLPLLALMTLLGSSAAAQIENPGFETVRDTAADLPKSWNFRKGHGYAFAIDNTIRHSGDRSLRITYTPDSSAPSFAPFSQVVPIAAGGLRRIDATVWVRMENLTADGGLWCQIWDSSNKQIGFKNLENQDIYLRGSSDWKPYTLHLVVGSDARKLLLGGYLGKGGTIWYDDFSIAEGAMASAPPSKAARRYVDAFRSTVKKHSIYSGAINWDSLDRELAIVSAGAVSYADAAESGSYIINKLRSKGDNHSFIMSASRTRANAAGNLDGRRPESRRIDANTGYIAVPGFMSMSNEAMQEFAASIQSQIRALDAAGPVTRWIVDLRENTGGNMYPMIAGLGPLIGNGNAGFFVTGNARHAWFYKDGRCGANNGTTVKVSDPYVLRSPAPKIAVLIGGRTSSSGEMTTISFIGKPNAKLFGQPSGGYTTGNSMHKLPDGSSLLLASSYVADRNGREYKGKIEPDVFLGENDDAVAAAVRWLSE